MTDKEKLDAILAEEAAASNENESNRAGEPKG